MYHVLNTSSIHICGGTHKSKGLDMTSWGIEQLIAIGMDIATFRHMWDFESNQPLPIRDISSWFKLDNREHKAVESMINSILAQWKTILQQQNIQAPIGDWIGCFWNRLSRCPPGGNSSKQFIYLFQSLMSGGSISSPYASMFPSVGQHACLPTRILLIQPLLRNLIVRLGLSSSRCFGFALLIEGKNKPSFDA